MLEHYDVAYTSAILMLHLMFSFSSVLLWCKCWLSSPLGTSNKVALRCRAEADYFESGCVLGFEPIRMNISTSLHRSHFGSRPSLGMQPDDRSHVSRLLRFSPTEAAFACMSLARAHRRLIHVLSLNASQRRIEDSLTLHDNATDYA